MSGAGIRTGMEHRPWDWDFISSRLLGKGRLVLHNPFIGVRRDDFGRLVHGTRLDRWTALPKAGQGAFTQFLWTGRLFLTASGAISLWSLFLVSLSPGVLPGRSLGVLDYCLKGIDGVADFRPDRSPLRLLLLLVRVAAWTFLWDLYGRGWV